MKNLTARLRLLTPLPPPEPTAEEIIFAQRALTRFHIAPLPAGYISFLKDCNSVAAEGSSLFGILPAPENPRDIVNANIAWRLPGAAFQIILGENEFDLLIYNHRAGCYQIIDKEDLEVLEEYSELEKAICNILKIGHD